MPPVSLEQFTRYLLNKKNGTYKCVFCSKEEFIVNIVTTAPDVDVNSPTPANALKPGDVIPAQLGVIALNVPPERPALHGFYSISCSTCGRTDFFHGNQIERWVSETSHEQETDEGRKE